jgi:hypothetical protein
LIFDHVVDDQMPGDDSFRIGASHAII